jgi:serine protease inhibitor
VVSASNHFARDLLREVAAEGDEPNVFLSPLSVSTALGMTMNGARGATFEEMRSTLGFGTLAQEEINASYHGLSELLLGLDPATEIRIANSIWSHRDFPFHPPFFDIGRRYFDAHVEALDFHAPSASLTINRWVSEKTNRRIPTIIEQIDPDEVMFLINAVYFTGVWEQRFDANRTQPAPFRRDDGETSIVQMMHRSGRGAFAMTIVISRPGRLDELVWVLDEERWRRWTDGLQERRLDVFLPRSTFEHEVELEDPLQALGMRHAFRGADFTGMSTRGEDLLISLVVHKTFVAAARGR